MALSHSSGTTTLTPRQTQSHSNKHKHSQCVVPPHLKYDQNTLGIYGTTTLGLIHPQNGAKRVGQDKKLLKLYHLYKICKIPKYTVQRPGTLSLALAWGLYGRARADYDPRPLLNFLQYNLTHVQILVDFSIFILFLK